VARLAAGKDGRARAAYWYWKAYNQKQPEAAKRWRNLYGLHDECVLRPIFPYDRPNRCVPENGCRSCHATTPR
jgi:hypothetical protein